MEAWDTDTPPPMDADMPPEIGIETRLMDLEAKVHRGHELDIADLLERIKEMEERVWHLVKVLEGNGV